MPTTRRRARTGPTVLSRPVAATLRAWAMGTIPPGAPAMATPSTRAMDSRAISAQAAKATLRASTRCQRQRSMALGRTTRTAPGTYAVRPWKPRTT